MDDSVVIVLIVGIIVIIIVIGIIIGSHLSLRSYLQMKRPLRFQPRQYLTTTVPPIIPTTGSPSPPRSGPIPSPVGSAGPIISTTIPGSMGPVQSIPTVPGATGSTGSTKPDKNVVLLGTVCPSTWTDIGEAGVLYSQQRLNQNPGFRLGASASPGWQWVHPRLCVGNTNRVQNGSGLFGLSQKPGSGPIGVLTPTNDLTTVPFALGATADSGWTWVEPNLVDATASNVFDLVGSTDPSGTSSIGLLANAQSLNNLQTLGVVVGSQATPGWNWVYPRLFAT